MALCIGFRKQLSFLETLLQQLENKHKNKIYDIMLNQVEFSNKNNGFRGFILIFIYINSKAIRIDSFIWKR